MLKMALHCQTSFGPTILGLTVALKMSVVLRTDCSHFELAATVPLQFPPPKRTPNSLDAIKGKIKRIQI
jgi:hypothetical protein